MSVEAVGAATYPLRTVSVAAVASSDTEEVRCMPESTAKKSTASKTPGKKAAAKKASAKQASAKQVSAKKAPAKKSPVRRLAVRPDESPWTAKELDAVRRELDADAQRLRGELATTESDLAELMRDGSDGAGNDQADVGASTLTRDHEMSLADNWREMLQQVEHAMDRMENGTYGVCEQCGNAIGKQRLMAFPRATLCLSCKQREERR